MTEKSETSALHVQGKMDNIVLHIIIVEGAHIANERYAAEWQ